MKPLSPTERGGRGGFRGARRGRGRGRGGWGGRGGRTDAMEGMFYCSHLQITFDFNIRN